MKRIKRIFKIWSLFITIIGWFIPINVYSEGIKAPFLAGITIRVEQGNADDPSNTVNNPNKTHTYEKQMAYAWDFNWGSGDDDFNYWSLTPVVEIPRSFNI